MNIFNGILITFIKKHFTAAIRVLLYFKGTIHHGIMIKKLKNLQLSNLYDLLPYLDLLSHVDLKYAKFINSKKSKRIYIFTVAKVFIK